MMLDPTRTPSSWRTTHTRSTAKSHASRSALGCAEEPLVTPPAGLSFRDFAAIQIAAAMKGTTRELSPQETAEVAFDIAAALEEERERRRTLFDEGARPARDEGPATG